MDRKFTEDKREARTYTSKGRARCAGWKMFGGKKWWRVVDIGCGEYVLDTMKGFLAKKKG